MFISPTLALRAARLFGLVFVSWRRVAGTDGVARGEGHREGIFGILPDSAESFLLLSSLRAVGRAYYNNTRSEVTPCDRADKDKGPGLFFRGARRTYIQMKSRRTFICGADFANRFSAGAQPYSLVRKGEQ